MESSNNNMRNPSLHLHYRVTRVIIFGCHYSGGSRPFPLFSLKPPFVCSFITLYARIYLRMRSISQGGACYDRPDRVCPAALRLTYPSQASSTIKPPKTPWPMPLRQLTLKHKASGGQLFRVDCSLSAPSNPATA